MKMINGLARMGNRASQHTCSLSSVSCLSCVANHSFVSEPFAPVVGFGGVALLMEVRRSGPLAVEVTLGGTADLALSANLEGAGRGGDEGESRLVGWDGVLVTVVAAMIYGK